jgi:hypothetical protein
MLPFDGDGTSTAENQRVGGIARTKTGGKCVVSGHDEGGEKVSDTSDDDVAYVLFGEKERLLLVRRDGEVVIYHQKFVPCVTYDIKGLSVDYGEAWHGTEGITLPNAVLSEVCSQLAAMHLKSKSK